MEPIGGGLSLGRGGEKGALVLSKDFQPVREIGGRAVRRGMISGRATVIVQIRDASAGGRAEPVRKRGATQPLEFDYSPTATI